MNVRYSQPFQRVTPCRHIIGWQGELPLIPPLHRWRAFLRQQAAGILACDLLHGRHRLAATALCAVPASSWTPGESTWLV